MMLVYKEDKTVSYETTMYSKVSTPLSLYSSGDSACDLDYTDTVSIINDNSDDECDEQDNSRVVE